MAAAAWAGDDGLWSEEEARQVLGLDAYQRAVRGWRLRPVRNKGLRYRPADVLACRPRAVSAAVVKEYAALRQAVRRVGLGG
jgi:hypothetical protein